MSDERSLLRHAHYRPRKRNFHGLNAGDEVCVHGEGFGRIVEMGEGEFPAEDKVVVEVPRSERHRSGQMIQWTERFTRHPIHVSRSARRA